VLQFDDLVTFAEALERAEFNLCLPIREQVAHDEWVLAIFEIGSRRRATAAAGRGVVNPETGAHCIIFEPRDWQRLTAFVAARSERLHAAPSKPLGEVERPNPRTTAADDSEQGPVSISGVDSSRIPLAPRVLICSVGESCITHNSKEPDAELASMLREAGLHPEVAKSATHAERRLEAGAFDAIVAVIDLTANDIAQAHIAVLRSFRQAPRNTPVLVVSPAASARHAIDAFEAGADDILTRPFRTTELAARIFGMLRRARLAERTSPSQPPSTHVNEPAFDTFESSPSRDFTR